MYPWSAINGHSRPTSWARSPARSLRSGDSFVAETIVTAIDDKTDEVFMLPESAADIIKLGVHPGKLLAIFDRAEQFGRDAQRQRRPS
jgi:hypothetical protein